MPLPVNATPVQSANNPLVNTQAGVVASQVTAQRASSKLGSSENDGVQVPKRAEKGFEGRKRGHEKEPNAADELKNQPAVEQPALDIKV